MQRRSRRRPIERAPQCLPINRNNSLASLGKVLHEANEPGVEACRIEQPEHAAERIVARNAVLKPQKFLQKLQLRPAEQRHVRTGLSAAQQRAKPNYQNLMQLMPFRVSRPRVFQILKNLTVTKLLLMLDEMRIRLDAPIQSCVLAHVPTTIAAIELSAPVDLVFQSIAG